MAKILIVDDSKAMRTVMSQTLEPYGYTVLLAKDGNQGLEVLDANDVDLVLTDVNMPNMDGIEFTRRVRGHARHGKVPVLVITTESRPSMLKKGKMAGASGWIVKPVNAQALKKYIEDSIKTADGS